MYLKVVNNNDMAFLENIKIYKTDCNKTNKGFIINIATDLKSIAIDRSIISKIETSVFDFQLICDGIISFFKDCIVESINIVQNDKCNKFLTNPYGSILIRYEECSTFNKSNSNNKSIIKGIIPTISNNTINDYGLW